MGKASTKKGAKKKKEKPVKMVTVVRLMDVSLTHPVERKMRLKMMQEGDKMEEADLTSVVHSEKLLCFNEDTFIDIYTIGPPYDDNTLLDVWCPSELAEAGTQYSFDRPVFIDKLSNSAYEIVLSTLKSREAKGLKAIQELMQMELSKDREQQKDKGQKHQHEASSSERQSITFKDLRGGGVKTMPLQKFFMLAQSQNLICFNYVGYAMLYEDEDEAKEVEQQSSTVHFWYPGKDWDDSLERELVYAEKFDKQHSFLFWKLKIGVDTDLEQEQVVEDTPKEQQPVVDDTPKLQEPVVEDTPKEQERISEAETQWLDEQTEDHIELWEAIKKKGFQATTKEICAAIDFKMGHWDRRFDQLERLIFCQNDRFGQLERLILRQNDRLDDLHSSLSRATERSSRQSFAQFYEKYLQGAVVQSPITNKLLPYSPDPNVEMVGKLCSMPGLVGDSMKPHPIPKYADIDILLKVKGGHTSSPAGNSVPTTRATEDVAEERFSEIVVGEATRSMALCSSSYFFRCPRQLENTPSTKLLYKFVQLERDILAAMEYYSINVGEIGGAAIISPSFMQTSEPRRLADRVLRDFGRKLVNVNQLHSRGRLWLMDL